MIRAVFLTALLLKVQLLWMAQNNQYDDFGVIQDPFDGLNTSQPECFLETSTTILGDWMENATRKSFKVMGEVFEYKTEPSVNDMETFLIVLVVSKSQSRNRSNAIRKRIAEFNSHSQGDGCIGIAIIQNSLESCFQH